MVLKISNKQMNDIIEPCIIKSLVSSINLRKLFFKIYCHIIEDKKENITIKILWQKMGGQFNYSYYHLLTERFVMWNLLHKVQSQKGNVYLIVDEEKWKSINEQLDKELEKIKI